MPAPTLDQIAAAFAKAGATDATIDAIVAGTVGLVTAAHAAGLDVPGALDAAGTLVKREQLSAQLLSSQGDLQQALADLDKQRQDLVSKQSDIAAQIAALNLKLAK